MGGVVCGKGLGLDDQKAIRESPRRISSGEQMNYSAPPLRPQALGWVQTGGKGWELLGAGPGFLGKSPAELQVPKSTNVAGHRESPWAKAVALGSVDPGSP